jgi:RNA polymerase sigma-70 factor (ECF subfamily)
MFQQATINENFTSLFNLREPRRLPTMMNETEFETFYDEHARPLWAYVRRLSDRAEIADDVVQESFMRFLSAQPKSNSNEKAYLYRIATNLTYDYFRGSKRDAKRQADFAASNNEEPAYEPFAANSGLAQVFHQMKMQERALLWLAYVEGHEHAEIAAMLGLKSLSVRVLLFRARRKLANLLETNEPEGSKL